MGRFLFVPYGSHGDVHPYVGIALELRSRGHEVLFFVNGHFAPLIEGLGFKVELFGTDEDFRRQVADPDIWDPRKGFAAVMRGIEHGYLRFLYDKIQEHCVKGETAVAASVMALGARCAREKLGIPLASMDLQPVLFRSVHAPPRLPGVWWPKNAPHAYVRFIFWLSDVAFVDPMMCPMLNRFRSEIGLPPVKRVINGWWHSPDLILALFPDWYGKPQPDWPPMVRCTGFPMYDETGATAMEPELQAFLTAGDPPLVFTPGTAHVFARGFFESAAAACTLLSKRGVLLSRHAQNIPASLPEGVKHFAYAPFSELLPRAAAFVHHGGMGSSAQGLKAGMPQLVWPLAHDQFDNSARLEALGVGGELLPKHFTPENIAAKLRGLLESPEVKTKAEALSKRLDAQAARAAAADALEELLAKRI